MAAVVVLGAFEHEVLEEVGVSSLARLLVLGSHVVPDVHRRQRQRVVLVQDNVQAVGKSEFIE